MTSTREGKRFFLATLLIGFAAFNTGNNLIFLIFSMMLSFLVLSFAVLRVNMHGLKLRISQEQAVYAQRPSDISVTVTNHKKYLHSYSVRVLSPGGKTKGTLFPRVAAASETSRSVPIHFSRRGFFRLGEFFIESTFPFILISRKTACAVEGGILVYPEIIDTDRIFPDLIGKTYESVYGSKRGGDEFSRIREFRYGDDWRRIHWKASAKTEKFMVMEYAEEESKRITIVFDNLKPHNAEAFEKSVSLGTSIAERLLREGFFVRLMTCRKLIPFGSGREHLFKILDLLAQIEGQDSWECPATGAPEGFTILILNSEESPLSKYRSLSDRVFYASDL
jgi:uncharacterized protein (DUF58 family)